MSMRHLAQTGIGMALAATPVALWIAWSPAMLAGTLVASVLCAGLLVLITEPVAHGSEDGARLSEEFVEEAQSLHPMIHHHAGHRPSSRFQRTMRRLARLAPQARG